MIKLNKATITVKAFFSVKYFFIAVDLHETKSLANIKVANIFSLPASMERMISSTKFCYKRLSAVSHQPSEVTQKAIG